MGSPSQHLASDRRGWETQGDKRETRPWSRRHSIWHLTGETGRQEDKRKTGPRNRRHTSHSLYLKLEPQCFAVWGKTNKKTLFVFFPPRAGSHGVFAQTSSGVGVLRVPVEPSFKHESGEYCQKGTSGTSSYSGNAL